MAYIDIAFDHMLKKRNLLTRISKGARKQLDNRLKRAMRGLLRNQSQRKRR